jgi:hypothetical protein
LSRRVLEAGFRLACCRDLFVHSFGTRSVAPNELDASPSWPSIKKPNRPAHLTRARLSILVAHRVLNRILTDAGVALAPD